MSRGLTATVLVCVAAAGVAVGALTLDAGGEGTPDAQDEAATGDGASATLVIDGFAYSSVTVSPGETVAVDNRDEAPHTVTAADGSFTTDTIDAGGSSSFTAPAVPGTHEFGCTIHPEMSGSLTVQATEGGAGQGEDTAGY